MGAVDAGRSGPHTPETTIARLRWRGMGEFGVASATSYRTRSAEAEPHLGMPAPRLTLILGFAEPIGLRTGPLTQRPTERPTGLPVRPERPSGSWSAASPACTPALCA